MDTPRRRKYLNALGIESWQLRASGLSIDSGAPAPAAIAVGAALPTAPPPTVEPSTPLSIAEPATPIARSHPAIELPQDWDALAAQVRDCRSCKLCTTRNRTVFGIGGRASPVLIVGEGPGADEDAKGEPFVGRAGRLLDEMLKAIGRSRHEVDADRAVYIANVVKCRPPGNRDPEPDEVEACRPYLEQQIRLLKPRLIVGLGRIAAQRLLKTDAPLMRLRGELHHYGPEQTPLMITYHPAYLLRSPREKAKSWEDLKKIHRFLSAP